MRRHYRKSNLAALSGLRRPGGRLVLGLVALLAWPLLARLGAALLARPRLRLRLPALFAALLLALAHQLLLAVRSASEAGRLRVHGLYERPGRSERAVGDISRVAAVHRRLRSDRPGSWTRSVGRL